MDADLFLADLESVPRHLSTLAASIAERHPWLDGPVRQGTRLVLLGMGSSGYAAGVAAARLRARGVDAVSELASSDLLPAASADTVVVIVSAGGSSREALAAQEHYRDRCPVVALTNVEDSAVATGADHVVSMRAGVEQGGVACRTFRHTLGLLLALEDHLLEGRPAVDVLTAASEASADLLDRRDRWLPGVTDLVGGPDVTAVVAPARRLSSALQGALMLREGPRRQAVGCETGDWSHVDVYLTKTTDYRVLLMAGSRWEDEMLRWTRERGSAVAAVGAEVEGATRCVRYRGDTDDDVRLLTEVLVPELAAAALWRG